MIETALRAIADPKRREILRLVHTRELSAGEIASRFDVTRPAISQHLSVLIGAELVSVRRIGTRRLYRARPERIDQIKVFLDEFWDDHLALLKEAAEGKSGGNRKLTTHETDYLEREVRIAARPETVFALLVEPDKMKAWMGQNVDLDPRPGRIYRVDVNGKDVALGEFVEVVPNSRVVFTWGWDEEDHPIPPGSTSVEITLREDGDGTIVTLQHSGLPADSVKDHTAGWDHYIARLVTAGEGRDPGPDAMMG